MSQHGRLLPRLLLGACLALPCFMLAACGDDAATPDAAAVADAAATDAAVSAADAGHDADPAAADAGADATPPDAGPIAPHRWSVAMPGGEGAPELVATHDAIYTLGFTSGFSTPSVAHVHRIVDGTITATFDVTAFTGDIAATDDAAFIELSIFGVVDFAGEMLGTADRYTLVVARLDKNARPVWHYLSEDPISVQKVGLGAANGKVVLGRVRRNSADTAHYFFYGITWLDAATGAVRHTLELPQLSGLAVSDNGKVFATGALIPGDFFNGTLVSAGSTFAAKFDESSSSPLFARIFPGIHSVSLMGLHAGDPVLSSTSDDGRSELPRLSGANGTILWTTRYDAGRSTRVFRFESDDAAAFTLVGLFADRVDFSASLRLECFDSADGFLATFDGAGTGATSALRLASTGNDDVIADFLPATRAPGDCDVISAALGGPAVAGADAIDLAPGAQGVFVATMCP